VDDDEAIRTATVESLARGHREVHSAADAEAALMGLDRWRPDVVLCDVRMPGLDGLELLGLLGERLPSADVIMMTAYDDMPTVVSAMRAGAVEFLVKPLDLHELRATVDRVFADRAERASAEEGESPLAADLQVLVGRDPRMIHTFKLIGQAAAVRTTVLIRGESGTGKGLVARAIHSNSKSASQPFVPVNCAALPSTLLESELFGHVRGAFTGAVGDRKGRFALAGAGTIFLDEIGDTSLEFQTKLLRVLQDGAHERSPTASRDHLDVDLNFRLMAETTRAPDPADAHDLSRPPSNGPPTLASRPAVRLDSPSLDVPSRLRRRCEAAIRRRSFEPIARWSRRSG
jgi:DNA-binding NtrC family response regulator